MRAEADETALVGIRGDGKTIAVLSAILAHAEVHKNNGFGLPVPWMAVRDSFANHKVTTLESLNKPLWRGKWKLYENNHLAAFRQGVGKDDLAILKLAGCDNMDSINKLRQEVVGVWVQEAAPVEESGGVSETAYGIMNSSKGRVMTHHSPTLLDLNYPDEDHWVWKRFFTDPQPGTKAFRIPPRENKHVDPSYWEKMEIALANRPDLRRRLLGGQPGTIIHGPQVAIGFREDRHVAPSRIYPIKGEPLCFGQDGGHTPATVIGQPYRGALRIYAALPMDRGGMRQQYESNVIPWLKTYAPWVMADSSKVYGCYDPSIPDDESDSDRNPVHVIRELLGGRWLPGPVDWEARKGMMISSFNMQVQGAFIPALIIDPVDARLLIQALSTRWHYPMDNQGRTTSDKPKQPNHPWEDLGQAYCYFLRAALPELTRYLHPTGVHVAEHDPFAGIR
jgi:hypothetical protein